LGEACAGPTRGPTPTPDLLNMTTGYGHNADDGVDDLDDAALVRRAAEGDEAALAAIVRRYQRLVYSVAHRYGVHDQAAADVFQAVWLRFIEKLPTITTPERVASWLITTASRECWRQAERARREAPYEHRDGDESDAPPDPADPRPLAEEQQLLLELQNRVRSAVGRLPERCRRIVEMLFYEDEPVSYAEIARRLGMPVDSVGPTRSRCFAKLRREMEELERRSGGPER
jgi:RNA polymerase sigma factor (sigma-70 family)